MNAATTTEGHESYLPTRGRSETEHDCGMSSYCGTYFNMRRTENENAYPSANETNGTSENPPVQGGGHGVLPLQTAPTMTQAPAPHV